MSRKLFSLVSCIEDVEPLFNSDAAPVEAIDAIGNHLILGSGNGCLVSIALVEGTQSKERVVFVENTVVVPQGRPVVQIKALSALNRILVLSDGSLYIFTLDSLKAVGPVRLRSVSCMALNECPNTDAPSTILMAVGLRRRQVALCELHNDRIDIALELDADDIPLTLGYDGHCVCYATASHFYIADFQTRATRPLFPLKNDDAQPIVRRIAKDEFLLTGVHNLGMFVTSDGVSNRPPISWEDDFPVDVALCFPYAVVLSRSFISIFGILDQSLKQKIPFSGGQCLCECEGELFVASRRHVYQLKPVHWEKQVESLLATNMADEALEIARNAQKRGSREEYFQRFRKIQQRCGFIKMSLGEWNEARDLLFSSRGDVREVISLYPGLLPSSSSFVRAIPPLHNLAEISSFAPPNDAEWQSKSERFLFDFLCLCRGEAWTAVWKKEIELALLKLSSEFDLDVFQSILKNSLSDGVLLDDARSWVSARKRFYAVAVLDWFAGRPKDAMSAWDRLVEKEIVDESFPDTLDFIVELLLECPNRSLVIDGCQLLLKHDEKAAIKVLLYSMGMKDVSLEAVEKLLDGKHLAFLNYLEERVRVQSDAHLQTRLGLLFMEVMSSQTSEENADLRKRFRTFLCSYQAYDSDALVQRLERDSKLEADHQQEKALLLGRLGLHEKALDVIIQCNDLAFVDEYCQLFARDRDRKFRHWLYSSLLKSLFSAQEKNRTLVAPIMRLLNNERVDVDLKTLLPLIPGHWSLESLKPFIIKNAFLQASAVGNAAVGSGLAKSRLRDTTTGAKQLSDSVCKIPENSRCSACDQLLEPNFVRYPNGNLVHIWCARYSDLCPATNQVFYSPDKN